MSPVTVAAAALLRIPYPTLCAALGVEPVASTADALSAMATFAPVGADGTACLLDVPLSASAEQLGDALAQLLGPALALHDDPRGVMIVPDSGLSAEHLAAYEPAVKHFGEAGEWIPAPESDALPPELAALMGGQGGALAGLQEQLAADPRMMAALGGGGDIFQIAQQMLLQMTPEQQAQVEQMARSMFGHLDPSALGAPLPAPPVAATTADDDDDPEFGK